MALAEQLSKDIITAHKSGKMDEVGVLRFLSSAIKNREIEKRGKGDVVPLTDDEVKDTLIKEAKKRKEAIDLYTKGGRADLAAKENAELEIIYRYIPRELSRADIETEIETLLKENPSREFSVLVKEAMQRLKGRADGKVVTEILKGKLG